MWIRVYSLPGYTVLLESEENSLMITFLMCDVINIDFILASAEPPWSSGLEERQNLILVEIFDRILTKATERITAAVPCVIMQKNYGLKSTAFHHFS